MKRLFAVILGLLGLLALTQGALAQVQLGISAGSPGPNHFYLSIGNYFNVPPQQVTVIHERDIPDEQIPVVLFIAQRAHVDPQEVIELREEGFSWSDVALRFGIGPDVFYVNVSNPGHSPYSRAFGYYRRYDKRKWRHIRLSDDDIVNLVNLRFMAENYHRTPDEIVRLRAQGRSFVDINEGWQPKDHFDRGGAPDNGQHQGWNQDNGRDGRHFEDNQDRQNMGQDHQDGDNGRHQDWNQDNSQDTGHHFNGNQDHQDGDQGHHDQNQDHHGDNQN